MPEALTCSAARELPSARGRPRVGILSTLRTFPTPGRPTLRGRSEHTASVSTHLR